MALAMCLVQLRHCWCLVQCTMSRVFSLCAACSLSSACVWGGAWHGNMYVGTFLQSADSITAMCLVQLRHCWCLVQCTMSRVFSLCAACSLSSACVWGGAWHGDMYKATFLQSADSITNMDSIKIHLTLYNHWADFTTAATVGKIINGCPSNLIVAAFHLLGISVTD